MQSRKQIVQKMALFYNEVKNKRKNKPMQLQVDSEFQKVKLKDLNEAHNVEMFTTSLHGRKAFAAEQKIRELKTRIAELNTQKLKISLTKIILSSASNMNNTQNEKYGLIPEEIEQKSLSNERFRTIFNMHQIEKTKLTHERLKRYDDKKYNRKMKKLREILNINEKVLVFAERIRKRSAPGTFYKQSVQNISYFNKEKIFLLERNKKIDKIQHYWLKDEKNKTIEKGFQTTEFFAVNNNFTM